MTSIRFVYFDLGNVLAFFSHPKMYAQVAALVESDEATVRDAIWRDRMSERVERGLITEDEQLEIICQRLGATPPRALLVRALCDIFTFNAAMVPVLERLAASGIPRGILSNTGTLHFRHCMTVFPEIVRHIPSHHALSYELGVMKPDRAIYEKAWAMAAHTVRGLEPNEIAFFDDLETNIDGALAFGFTACLYTDVAAVAAFLSVHLQ